MLVYKIDVLQTLKENGYNHTRLYREKKISQSSIQKIREGKMIGIITLNAICEMLDMQPGNIIKYVPDDEI